MSFYTKSDAGSTYHALMIGELPNPSKKTNKQTNKVFSILSSKLMVSQNRTNKATLPHNRPKTMVVPIKWAFMHRRNALNFCS